MAPSDAPHSLRHRQPDLFETLAPSVEEIGLRMGERVRFRPWSGKRWRAAVVHGRRRDGSVDLVDDEGRARALPLERIERQVAGPRGGMRWVPATCES